MLKSVSKSRGGKGTRRGLYNKVYGDGDGIGVLPQQRTGWEVDSAPLSKRTAFHYPK
ncbi:MAG: hypothetical protein J6B92_00095 [Paraprevotella sp.]|nr:hypothetical protein [Paraprevotella sp.]